MNEYATIEHYVNNVIGEITERDVEQVSEMLYKLGWEKVETCYPINEYHELHGTDCPAWKCSVCGDEFPAESNYCSNCGLRVDKEKTTYISGYLGRKRGLKNDR